MAILQECCRCHRKQATKNKMCKCGADLDKLKRARKNKFWISYRMPDGKQRKESISKFEGVDPFSISDAKEVESKRMIQRREHKLFDMQPESVMSFDLGTWGWRRLKPLPLSRETGFASKTSPQNLALFLFKTSN